MYHTGARGLPRILKAPRWLPVLLVLMHHASLGALTQPPGGTLTVYPHIDPGRHYVSESLNRYILESWSALLAYDLESGEQCWVRFRAMGSKRMSTTVGRRHLALYSDTEGLVVLDLVSGQDRWRILESRDGPIISAAFSDRSETLGILQERAWRVYSIAGELLRREPTPSPLSVVHAIPDSDAFFLERHIESELPPSRTQVYLWRPEGNGLVKAFDLESPVRFVAALPEEEFLTYSSGPQDSGYAVVDGTGNVLRGLGHPGEYLGYNRQNDTLAFFLTQLDRPTGKVVATNTLDIGQIESRYFPYTDGLVYTDESNHLYYQPFHSPLQSPNKIMDGHHFLPGTLTKLAPPYLECLQGDRVYTWERRRLEDMEPLKKAVFHGIEEKTRSMRYLSSDPVRLAQHYRRKISGDADEEIWNRQDWYYTGTTFVYEADQQTPLLMMNGALKGFSPDGRFIILQTKPDEARLVDVESGAALAIYAVKERMFINTMFSHDNRRVAIFHRPDVSTTILEPPYTKLFLDYPNVPGYIQQLLFSPDGALLLTGDSGNAWLHDATTGELLHNFVEPARFKERYLYREGFLNAMRSVAEDFAGRFTDRFKRGAPIRAYFSRNQAEVVTIAQDNLLRVWDASTGRELRRIDFNLPEARGRNEGINNQIVLSPNGEYALALNTDGFSDVSLWSVRTGRVLRRFPYPGLPFIDYRAVSDDGQKVYLGTESMLLVYDFSGDATVRQ